MGEIADMMLDGTLCEGCGVMVDGATTGYVRYCPGCERENHHASTRASCNELNKLAVADGYVAVPGPKKVICPDCNKRISAVGYKQHWLAKHRSRA